MKLEENIAFGLYELSLYAEAAYGFRSLQKERDEAVKELYADISPTMTTFNYDEGRSYTVSYNPEDTGLEIISTKERYQKILGKLEYKAQKFEESMETLTDRERDVVRISYFDHQDNLGVSPEYFRQVLESAQVKLCSFLGELKSEQIKTYEEYFKNRTRQRVKAS